MNWRRSRRFLYEKEIVSKRLQSGFSFKKLPKSWEMSGFNDKLIHVRNVIGRVVHEVDGESDLFKKLARAKSGIELGWCSKRIASHW